MTTRANIVAGSGVLRGSPPCAAPARVPRAKPGRANSRLGCPCCLCSLPLPLPAAPPVLPAGRAVRAASAACRTCRACCLCRPRSAPPCSTSCSRAVHNSCSLRSAATPALQPRECLPGATRIAGVMQQWERATSLARCPRCVTVAGCARSRRGCRGREGAPQLRSSVRAGSPRGCHSAWSHSP